MKPEKDSTTKRNILALLPVPPNGTNLELSTSQPRVAERPVMTSLAKLLDAL